MLGVEFPCCASKLLLVQLTDESSNYSPANYDEAVEADLKALNKAIKCVPALVTNFAIFQAYSGEPSEDDPLSLEKYLWHNGWQDIVDNFDLPEGTSYDIATTNPTSDDNDFSRYHPDDIINFIQPLIYEHEPKRIVYVVDNSGSITFDQIRTELRAAVDHFTGSIKQTITYGGESYFADFARTLERIGRGDFIKALPESFWG